MCAPSSCVGLTPGFLYGMCEGSVLSLSSLFMFMAIFVCSAIKMEQLGMNGIICISDRNCEMYEKLGWVRILNTKNVKVSMGQNLPNCCVASVYQIRGK